MHVAKYALINIIIGILLLSGTVYLTDQWRVLQPYFLFGSLILIIIMFLFCNQNFRVNVALFFTASLFFISCLVSSVINQDLYLLEGAISLYLMYIVLIILYPSIIRREDSNKLLAYSFLLFHIPLLIIPVLISGINAVPYYGIFYNPNSLGCVAAIAFIVILSRVSAMIDEVIFNRRINIVKLLGFLLFLLGAFTLILYSNSRTSFFAVIIISIIYLVMVLSRLISKNTVKLGAIIRIFLIAALFCAVYFTIVINTNIAQVASTTVINKIQTSSEDMFSGRAQIWAKAVDDAKLFGNGRDYFISFSEGAHSTYVSVLGQYGVIPDILFILFIIMITYYSYIYIKRNDKDNY